MFVLESSTSALFVLVSATVVMAVAAGPVLAYMIWASERGIYPLRRWVLWLVTVLGLVMWARIVGTALDTPGISDASAVLALVAGIPVFLFSYLLKRRSLLARNL